MTEIKAEQPPDRLIHAWREILNDGSKSWVVFENGTCVILMEPDADLAKQATELLSEWGPVHAGGPAGDFEVIYLDDPPGGWVVTGHHPDVLNYVCPQDMGEGEGEPSSIAIGFFGRSNRGEDAGLLKIVHVEDNRG